MKPKNRIFNPRVYGIYLSQQSVLYSQEVFQGKEIIKFPGGGLEYGESLPEALKREFIEEKNLEIKVLQQYYTVDFFAESFFDGSQVLPIYYLIDFPDLEIFEHRIKNQKEDSFPLFKFVNLQDIDDAFFTFETDRFIAQKLKNEFT